jgi:hypothetical protein
MPAFVRAVVAACGFACAAVEPCFAASGAFADKAASFLAVFIIIVMPIGGIVLFWLVHVLPEKIAEKRHHPQKDAIHVLCLLSLVFGGLLWPLAWLWAYSKPVLHQLAYGRDKHEDFYAESEAGSGGEAAGDSVQEELGQLRHDLEELEKRGELPASLKGIRQRVATLEGRLGSAASPGGEG